MNLCCVPLFDWLFDPTVGPIPDPAHDQGISYQTYVTLVTELNQAESREAREQLATELFDLLVANKEYVVNHPALRQCALDKLLEFAGDGFYLDWHFQQLFDRPMVDPVEPTDDSSYY